MTAVLTTSGRIAIATAIKARTAHMAWGTGDAAWGTTPPDPPASATALVAEVGRRKAQQVRFCTPDANGTIYVPEGRFNITDTPTRYLVFQFNFDFTEASTSIIREQAIFLDTVAAAGVPSGQFYLSPSEVANPGTLLVVQRPAPIQRAATTRQFFENVVVF